MFLVFAGGCRNRNGPVVLLVAIGLSPHIYMQPHQDIYDTDIHVVGNDNHSTGLNA